MVNQSEHIKDKASDILNKLLFDHYYALSTEAACRGDYSLATTYISDLIKSSGEIPVLIDLQAKIYAQQGKLKDAESLWKKCIMADPDSDAYVRALNQVRKLQKSMVYKNLYIYRLIAAIIIIFLLSFFIVNLLINRSETITKIGALQKQQEYLLEKLDSTINIENTSIPGDLLDQIMKKVALISGITVLGKNNGLYITFKDGLFSSGTAIKNNLKPDMTELSRVFEKYSDKIIIMIFGSTDDVPLKNDSRYKNNSELSEARALSAYKYINENSRIPNENILIGKVSEESVPFSNYRSEEKIKNRTVLIKVILK
jgi:flagellar motor protein MotB